MASYHILSVRKCAATIFSTKRLRRYLYEDKAGIIKNIVSVNNKLWCHVILKGNV